MFLPIIYFNNTMKINYLIVLVIDIFLYLLIKIQYIFIIIHRKTIILSFNFYLLWQMDNI